MTDLSLIDRCAALYPAVVSDILDDLGYRDQVMAPRIRPLYPEARVCGLARTVQCAQVDGRPERPEDYYRNQIAAIESLGPENVMIVSQIEVCFWGELLSIASLRRGARGIVIDGYTRDTAGIIDVGFPTFITGIHCSDALGRVDVVDFGCEIVSGDVTVNDGDLILGSYDGIVVVPADIAEQVVELADKKVSGENMVRVKLDEGMSVSEAYARYGIL